MQPSFFNLDAGQTEIVMNAVKTDFSDKIKMRTGRDGHAYILKIYNERIIEQRFWCVVPKELKHVAEMINMLVDAYKSSDKEDYYCILR